MKVVGFNSSPRRGGNTAQLLEVVCQELQQAGIETEVVELAGAHPHGCIACNQCRERKDGRCAVTTDPMNEWIEKMREADGMLLASPTYFADITPELKALIDRAGYVARANDDMFRRKVGAAIVVARRAGQNFTFAQINYFFLISEMIVPGSTYWNIAFGRKKGEVRDDAEGLDTVKTLAENMAWTMSKLAD